MKIKIDQIIDHGTLTSERVLISVTENADLSYFIIADTTYTSNDKISNKLRHMHWFSPKPVKAGDKVELYTKSGTNSQTDIGNGNTKYVIHWGLGNPVWNNDGDAAILFAIQTWKTTKAKGTT